MGPAFEGVMKSPDFAAASARLRTVTRIDLALFLIIFTCMILMRLGY